MHSADYGRQRASRPGHTWQAERLSRPPGWLSGWAFAMMHHCQAPKGKRTAPAVVLPWVAGGRLVAVRYRFLEPQTYTDDHGNERAGERLVVGGSQRGRLFGGQALPARWCVTGGC